MKPATVYFLLFIVGTIVPYVSFVPFLLEHGIDLPLIVKQIRQTPIATFGWTDVVISALVTCYMIWQDAQRFEVRRAWLPVVATLLIGGSAGLPLFLYLRERSRINVGT